MLYPWHSAHWQSKEYAWAVDVEAGERKRTVEKEVAEKSIPWMKRYIMPMEGIANG